MDELWVSVMDAVKAGNGVDAAQADLFLTQLHLETMGNDLVLMASDEFVKKWIEVHYLDKIKQTLAIEYDVAVTVLLEGEAKTTRTH